MHIPSSLLTPLVALLALAPSITANPIAQSANELIDPIPAPDFSHCFFIQIIRPSIEGAFTLTAISDTLPLQSWAVQLRSSSAGTRLSPYITRTRRTLPQFELTGGSLNTTRSDGTSVPGRFVPTYSSKVLQRLLFSDGGEPSNFYWIDNCDASGRQYQELKAGRGTLIFVSGEVMLILGFFLRHFELHQLIPKERKGESKITEGGRGNLVSC